MPVETPQIPSRVRTKLIRHEINVCTTPRSFRYDASDGMASKTNILRAQPRTQSFMRSPSFSPRRHSLHKAPTHVIRYQTLVRTHQHTSTTPDTNTQPPTQREHTSRNARLCFFANSIASSWVTVRKCLRGASPTKITKNEHKKDISKALAKNQSMFLVGRY